MSRTKIRLLGGAAVVAVAAFCSASPALAHVTVNPSIATQGGFAKLTFRVPTESDDASTTKLQVVFPANQPLGFVAVKPHAGWTASITKATLAKPITTDDGPVTEAVSQIVWTASSAATAIKPGQFDEFDVSVGPLPTASSMVFKVVQTYSDGSVVRWIETPAAGAAEPEHPAPTLTLTPAAAEGAAGGTQVTAAAPKAAAQASGPSSTSVDTALGLAGAALVIGLGAGALGVVALRRRTLPAATPERERIEV